MCSVCIIIYISFLSSLEHHKKTRHYWWEHGLDKAKLQTFLVFDAEYRHFKDQVGKALSELEDQKKETRERVC